jgi:membrane protein required for colicin V production
MALDLLVLAVLAIAALLGARSGALAQLVQLGAALLGWVAARQLGAAVSAGLARSVPPLLARAGASALLFLGTFALVSLVGGALLRATGISAVVRGPVDRGAGALLGGAKGGLAAWVLLSALALAGGTMPGGLAVRFDSSDFASLARRHNLLLRIDPRGARALERALRAARAAERAGRLAAEPEGAQLLADPRLRALSEGDATIDDAEAARVLEDPEVRALVERLRARVERERGAGAEAPPPSRGDGPRSR